MSKLKALGGRREGQHGSAISCSSSIRECKVFLYKQQTNVRETLGSRINIEQLTDWQSLADWIHLAVTTDAHSSCGNVPNGKLHKQDGQLNLD